MYWTLTIIGILFIAFMVYMAVRETTSLFGPRAKPDASTGYKPSVRPKSAKTKPDALLTFKGEGSGHTDSFFLECAIYRIEYQLPKDTKVKIELVSTDGDTRKLLAHKVGFDSSSFNAPAAKYYMLDITTEAQESSWAVLIKPF
ncbi:MAG: hypothetical protein ABI690_31695 [Chloroflexota bacterium]